MATKLSAAQIACLADACTAGWLHRVRCGWQTTGGHPITGHSPATVRALVNRGLLKIENFTGARPTPKGRRMQQEIADA